MMMRSLLLTALLAASFAPIVGQNVPDQGTERRGRNLPPGETVVGKVTSVGKDSVVVAPLTGGDPVTVKVGDSTRIMKERQPVKLEEIKTDDMVFARGELKSNVLEAAVVGVVNQEMIQRFGQGGGAGGGRGFGGGFNREDLGKKFIAGEVKAINETKLTIARPDGQSQEIEVDENTSFKRGNESITLPDIKVGDFVRGPGELKNDVFVSKELTVGRPQMQMRFGGPGTTPPQNPPADKPSTAAAPKN